MTTLSLSLPTAPKRAAFGKIVQNEARLALRRPARQLGSIAIPLVLVVLFGKLGTFHQAVPGAGGLTLFDAYVPVLMVFSLAMLALMGLPMPLASYRELGVLRRLSTTPVPPSWVLAAQGIVQLCVALATIAIVLTASIAAFGERAPVSPTGLAASIVLAIAGLFPIGLVIAAAARTAGGANVLGRVAFFPLMFFAGLWLPRALMPPALLDISNFTPLGAAVQAIQASMLQGFPPVAPLLVLAGYAVLFSYLARRFFRWE